MAKGAKSVLVNDEIDKLQQHLRWRKRQARLVCMKLSTTIPLFIFTAVPMTSSVRGITPIATMTRSQGTWSPLVKITPPTTPSFSGLPRIFWTDCPVAKLTPAFLMNWLQLMSEPLASKSKLRIFSCSSTTVTFKPCLTKASVTLIPINPPPMTTALLAFMLSILAAIRWASAMFVKVNTPSFS